MNSWIGERGRWAEDNDYCEIVSVVDEGAGLYEFHSLDPDSNDPDWIGFIEDFFPEDNEC